MRIIGILLILIGIISGLLGLRSYMRDDAYAKASVVVKASVISAKVEPNPWKNVDHVRLVLLYMRDGVTDSIENNYADVYSKDELRTSEEELKAATYYIRYVPKEKRSKNIPDWVMVSNKDKHDGVYGQTGFGWMFKFLIVGIFLIIYSRVRRKSRELFSLQK